MEAKLLKAERLAAIGELAGIIGHDLRNPLQGIRSATYYLKTHSGIAKDDPACSEMLDEIDNCIKRSDKIINDLIDYSQAITLHPSPTDPKTLIGKSLNQIAVPANIEIVNNSTDKPALEVDVLKIEHAFTAIIKNALDAMPEDGKSTIKTKTGPNFVVFSFQDTGSGMNQETLSKLFTPMFTTKAKGMGFGLAVCKRFIEAHGGKIAVKSCLGKGTTITIALPTDPNAVD